MDIVAVINRMERGAFADKKIYHVSDIDFSSGSYVVNGIDSAALALDPSPLIIQFADEIGEDRVYLLMALTDLNDNPKVAEMVVPKRAAKLSSKRVDFVSSGSVQSVKSVDQIVGFSEPNVIFRDLLIDETLGTQPSNWNPINKSSVVVDLKDGKYNFHGTDADSTLEAGDSLDLGSDYATVESSFFVNMGQTNRVVDFGFYDNNFPSSGYMGAVRFANTGIIYWVGSSSIPLQSYNADEEYHIRIKISGSSVTTWVNGVQKGSGLQIAAATGPARHFVHKVTGSYSDVTWWMRNPTFWTGGNSGNEGDSMKIVGLSGSIARLVSCMLLPSDETRILANQLQYCQDPSTAWGYPLSLIANSVQKYRESGELDARLRRRVKPFHKIWSPTIPEIKEIVADLFDITDESLIRLREYEPHYWGMFLPLGGAGSNAVWLETETSEWQAFLEEIKPIATNVLCGFYASIIDDTLALMDKFYVGTALTDFENVWAPFHGHTQYEHALDAVHGAGLSKITYSDTFIGKILHLTESAGVERLKEFVDVPVTGISSGECYYDSVRLKLFPNIRGVEIPSAVWNMINDCANSGDDISDWTDLPLGTQEGQWLRNATYSGQICRMLPNFRGYRHVLQVVDSSGASWINLDDLSWQGTNPVTGTFYVCVMLAQTDQQVKMAARDDAVAIPWEIVFATDGNIKTNTGAGLTTLQAYSADTWYIIGVEFNCTTDKVVSVSINGTVYPIDESFITASNYIDYWQFSSWNGGGAGTPTFFCAWTDFDWDAGYYSERYNYLKAFNIAFLADVSGSSLEKYNIRWDDSSIGFPSYSGLSRTGNQVTCSTGAIYNFGDGGAGANRGVLSTATDPESNNDAVYQLTYFPIALSGNLPFLYLEDNPIFVQMYSRVASNEHADIRIYDNGIIKETMCDDGAFGIEHYPRNADPIKWYTHYYDDNNNVWQSNNLNTGAATWQGTPATVGKGKMFFDKSTSFTSILANIFDESQDSENIQYVYTFWRNSTNYLGWTLGRNSAGAGYILGPGEFIDYIGLLNAGGTAVVDKKDFVDNLYVSLISNPLQQTLI